MQLPLGHMMLEYPNRTSLAEYDPITHKIAAIAYLNFGVAVSFNVDHTANPMAP